MRRRSIEKAAFLERPAGWWQQRRPHLNAAGYAILAFAGTILAQDGELRADEVERLQRIAAGLDTSSPIRPDTARAILSAR